MLQERLHALSVTSALYPLDENKLQLSAPRESEPRASLWDEILENKFVNICIG